MTVDEINSRAKSILRYEHLLHETAAGLRARLDELEELSQSIDDLEEDESERLERIRELVS